MRAASVLGPAAKRICNPHNNEKPTSKARDIDNMEEQCDDLNQVFQDTPFLHWRSQTTAEYAEWTFNIFRELAEKVHE
jgi:hypothetical protein